MVKFESWNAPLAFIYNLLIFLGLYVKTRNNVMENVRNGIKSSRWSLLKPTNISQGLHKPTDTFLYINSFIVNV